MNRIASLLLLWTALLASGCNFYSDDPPTRTISGTILIDATGEPLSGARISFISGRKVNPYHFPPSENLGIDAVAKADSKIE